MERQVRNMRYDKFSVADILIHVFLVIFSISILYPIYNVIVLSFCSYDGLLQAGTTLVFRPYGFTLNGYITFLTQDNVLAGYYQTIFRTFAGTFASIILMSMAAYAISKKKLIFNKFFTLMFVITMFFSGGLIPGYLLIKNLHLLDNTLVYILGPLYNTFYVLILRNFFMNIPESLEESCRIDGGNDIQIFWHVILPLSKPALATVCIWQMVNHWNAWFDSMLYIQTPTKQVLQMVVRRVVYEQSDLSAREGISFIQKGSMPTAETLSAVAIIVAILPIMIAFPFFKKYFNQGIMLGAVKE